MCRRLLTTAHGCRSSARTGTNSAANGGRTARLSGGRPPRPRSRLSAMASLTSRFLNGITGILYAFPRRLAALLSCLSLLACAGAPADVDDGCAMLEEKRGWYRSAERSYKRWGVPVHVQLAIIYQESRFEHDAKPPRDTLLWVIPWFRRSSAYGYAQAKDETWAWYQRETGNSGADRDDFADAVDFIGWYGTLSHRQLKISKWDAYNQYLAYHEGHGGYRRGSYRSKSWLLGVARKVRTRAERYRVQLGQCADRLDRGWWPF